MSRLSINHGACPGDKRDRRSGQAIIESCIVILFICLICFGLLQVSRFFAAREILDYSASRGARARTVGFNQFMLLKAVRVSTIPSAGRMLFPTADGDLMAQQALESARIPLYLGAQWPGHLPGILNYEYWPNITFSHRQTGFGDQIDFQTRQVIPFTFPLYRLYYEGENLAIEGQASMENHFPLYLQNLEL